MSAYRTVALSTIGLVVYSYAAYPLLLVIIASARTFWSRLRSKPSSNRYNDWPEADWPAVAVVVSAFNEERCIGARIRNLLACDYPPHLLNIYVGSDGSHDTTAAIISAFVDPRVHAYSFDLNRGKATVLNDLLHASREPLVIFSDANTFFPPLAIKALVLPFVDARVGGVSGELRLLAAGGSNPDSLYWRLEQKLKLLEASIGGLLGANGAIYAIRRELWSPLRPDTICDDFCIAMNVAAAGYKLAYEPAAWAEEETPSSIGDEYRRRVRIGIGNYQALFRNPQYLLRTSLATRLAYLSHKVVRWLAPHLLIVGFVCSLLLASNPAWRAFAMVQLIIYGGSALLYLASERAALNGKRLPGLLNVPAFLFALNWAFLIASYRYATGRYAGTWRRTAR